MKADEATRLRQLESENAKLKKLLAEAELDKVMLKELAAGFLTCGIDRTHGCGRHHSL